jgi:hypothetical protein
MDVTNLSQIPPWEWPEEAHDLLVRELRDGERDAADRPLAAQLAGDYVIIDDQLVGLLLGLIKDGDEPDEVRAAAAIALGPALEHGDIDGFDDPEDVPISEKTFRIIQDTLRELYQEGDLPKEVRRRVLEGAVRAPQEWHVEAVREAFSSDDPDWRLTAAFCAEYVKGFDKQILDCLGSDNEHIHYHAVIASGNWSLDEAWDHVAGLLESTATDKPLMMAAIDAVVSIRPDEAEALLGDLLDSADEDIADAAYEALGMAKALSGLDFDDDDDSEDW